MQSQKKTVSKIVESNARAKGHINQVNLGPLFLPANAVDNSPVFNQNVPLKTFFDIATEPLHVALVAIKSPQSIDDETLEGVGLTLSQLAKLGLNCIVVVDPQDEQLANPMKEGLGWRLKAFTQADRVVAAIDRHGGTGARRLDSVIGLSPLMDDRVSTVKVRGSARVIHPNLLLTPLRRGIIPVIVPVGYTAQDQKAVGVNANEVVLALTRELAGIAQSFTAEEDPSQITQKIQTAQKNISLDRIILLNPYGGIPSTNSSKPSHVFINLEQEYEEIRIELMSLVAGIKETGQWTTRDSRPTTSSLRQSNTLSTSSECEIVSPSTEAATNGPTSINSFTTAHLDSLQLIRDALAILPPSSSALLTTPREAAKSAHSLSSSSTMPRVGTRSSRNPLIHNLLTDKPIFSSSLPRTRLFPFNNPKDASPAPPTFVKRGMPLTIVPDPRLTPWAPSIPTSPVLQLSDPRIDLSRLVHLIEDSFSRPLNAEHYLARVAHSLAGIIIAGSYEGAAILTWETPPDLPSTLVPGTPAHSARLVPYLDKFAVLKRSQGAGGVADIVFSAMVRDCFPKGVVWRSRRDNPVNKWYFERARGTWKIPVEKGAQGWTMFWTTEGVRGERFRDYEGVCRSVGTSWADRGRVLD